MNMPSSTLRPVGVEVRAGADSAHDSILSLAALAFVAKLARKFEPRRRELMAKVDVVADSECDAIYPMQFPSILRVRTTDGTEHIERVLSNRGGPERPLSGEELAAKFRINATRVVPEETARSIEGAVEQMESMSSIRDLMEGV